MNLCMNLRSELGLLRACAAMDRAANYGIHTERKQTDELDLRCAYCGAQLLETELVYVNTPRTEYLLCHRCGDAENILYTNHVDNFIVHKIKIG